MSAPAEETLLGVVLLGLVALPVTHQLFDEGHAVGVARISREELAAREVHDRIEGPGIGQVLKTLAVHEREIDPFDQVVDVLEAPVGLALGDDAVHGRLTDALDGPQTEAHVARRIGREGAPRLVYVGTQHTDAHAFALVM